VNGECVPFARIHKIPAEPKRVRRERTNTPNRTGKQQQKCLGIFVEFVVVLAVDWATATARDGSLPTWTMQRDELVCEA
jgi:hypothetical protein